MLTIPAAWNLIGWLLLICAAGYCTLTALVHWRWSHRPHPASGVGAALPVTLLKPLCGAEPRLYENLRSFCLQDYPRFQIVFATRNADDEALGVVRRLQEEFPQLDLAVVSDPRVHGVNLKVSNVLNALPVARYDVLVIVDSDIWVDPHYLFRVTQPLQERSVGLVTSLYRGRALGGTWTRLGKQFIDEWFRPAVLLSRQFGSTEFGSGATLALRRDTLEAIGGMDSLLPFPADDYALGALTRARGLRTVLSDEEVVTDVTEQSLSALASHELRWLRTIRLVRPLSYLFLFITFTVPAAVTGWCLAGASMAANVFLETALVARLALHWQARRDDPTREGHQGWFIDLVLLACRDTLSLVLWATAFLGRRIRWRGQILQAVNDIPSSTTQNSSEACYK